MIEQCNSIERQGIVGLRRVSPTYMLLSVLLAGFLVGGVAFASQQTGLVTEIFKRASDGLTYINMSGTRSAKPACATYSYWMIIDENSNVGKQQLAMLLAARSSGQTITVIGTDACTRWTDGEDVNAISY